MTLDLVLKDCLERMTEAELRDNDQSYKILAVAGGDKEEIDAYLNKNQDIKNFISRTILIQGTPYILKDNIEVKYLEIHDYDFYDKLNITGVESDTFTDYADMPESVTQYIEMTEVIVAEEAYLDISVLRKIYFRAYPFGDDFENWLDSDEANEIRTYIFKAPNIIKNYLDLEILADDDIEYDEVINLDIDKFDDLVSVFNDYMEQLMIEYDNILKERDPEKIEKSSKLIKLLMKKFKAFYSVCKSELKMGKISSI